MTNECRVTIQSGNNVMYLTRIKNSIEYFCRRVSGIKSIHSSVVSLLILFALLLQGCAIPVLVPWFGEPPYDKSAIEQYLIPKSTTQSDVFRAFGKPAVSWNDGRLLLYAGFEKTKHDIISQASKGKGHYIVLEFDEEGLLKRYDYFLDKQCTSWGLCFDEPLERHWSYSKFLGFSDQYLVGPAVALKASKHNDEVAKKFEKVSGRCSIYVYYSDPTTPISPRRPVLCRKSQECRELKPGSFIYWSQNSKNNLLKYSLGQFRLGIVNIDVINEVEFQTSCKTKGLTFARVFYNKIRWYGKYEVQVEYEDVERGKSNVRKLWLMQD